jgi:transcriptional regulator with XRE-family HTH domain
LARNLNDLAESHKQIPQTRAIFRAIFAWPVALAKETDLEFMLASRQKGITEVDQRIGARVRRRRKQLRLSQTALGQLIGVSFQQIQKYERGKNRIGAGRLLTVAEVLGVPVDYFFTESDTPKPESTPGAFDLLLAYDAIKDPVAREAVLLCAQILANVHDFARIGEVAQPDASTCTSDQG